MKGLKILLAVFLVAFLTVPCFAEVPRLIHTEELTNKNESPYLPVTYEVNFYLPDSDSVIIRDKWHTVELDTKPQNQKDESRIFKTCRSTYSSCGYCGSTYSTCGYCSPTLSTCGIFCSRSSTFTGKECRYRASDTPSPTPAF